MTELVKSKIQTIDLQPKLQHWIKLAFQLKSLNIYILGEVGTLDRIRSTK